MRTLTRAFLARRALSCHVVRRDAAQHAISSPAAAATATAFDAAGLHHDMLLCRCVGLSRSCALQIISREVLHRGRCFVGIALAVAALAMLVAALHEGCELRVFVGEAMRRYARVVNTRAQHLEQRLKRVVPPTLAHEAANDARPAEVLRGTRQRAAQGCMRSRRDCRQRLVQRGDVGLARRHAEPGPVKLGLKWLVHEVAYQQRHAACKRDQDLPVAVPAAGGRKAEARGAQLRLVVCVARPDAEAAAVPVVKVHHLAHTLAVPAVDAAWAALLAKLWLRLFASTTDAPSKQQLQRCLLLSLLLLLLRLLLLRGLLLQGLL
mmetsp:Transcript_29587/g.87513  ORF Transcript_29587/g.87513 Transcript_29587/m.87513 type:complete len:322 (-) Transcript_29587:410-1375(-)